MGPTTRVTSRITAARVREYLRSCVRIDTRTLAVFRVLVGLLIVADVLLRFRNFRFFYTEEGVVPQSLATASTPDYAFSVYYFTTDTTLIFALFVLQALIAVQLIVGYKTRIATVLSFLFVVSLDHHNPLVLSYADTLFRLLMFWAIFLPLGERWSVDAIHADRAPRGSVVGVASAAILLQMIVMYVVNGYHKAHSELWITGEAAVLVFGLDNITFLLGDVMRNVPVLLQIGGFTWYAMLLFAWVLLLLQGRKRTLLVGLFLAGHAAFAITVRIGAFPYVSIAGVLLFLQASFWADAHRVLSYFDVDVDRSRFSRVRARLVCLARSIPEFRVAPGIQDRINGPIYTVLIGIIAVTILMVLALSMLQMGGVVEGQTAPEQHVETVAASLGIDQPQWTIFAPHPRTVDRYYVFPARTTDGDYVDVYNDRSLTFARPHDELQKQFGTYRERFYMNSIRRAGEFGVAPRHLAEHMCAEWEDESGAELTHVTMYYVTEDVTRETIDAPEKRDREATLIYEHGCGDYEPKEIADPTF